MRKIRLSDTDLELFDIEIGPDDYTYYQRHKDAFKTMWREQGKPFWTRFQITFRSFTVKHGVIKHMNIDSPKFQNILDEAFIFIHEQFVDGKESTARNFIDDVARLAQNQDKFPALDSKSFSKDPFFTRDTRELFRKFFGKPDQKSSYLKVYILCPVYLRFGGSVCRCLIRWMEADTMSDPNDDSYWIPPQSQGMDKNSDEIVETTMCSNCVDDCGTKYFKEKIMGNNHEPISLSFWTIGDPRFNDADNPLFAPHLDPSEDWRSTKYFKEKIMGNNHEPISLSFWTIGDPRFNDADNPLFAPHLDPSEDWRSMLTVDLFRDFYNYAKFKYGDGCSACTRLKKKRDKVIHVCRASKKKKKQPKTEQELLIQDLREVRDRIDEFEDNADKAPEYEECIHEMLKEKPRVKEFLQESGIKPPGADRRAIMEDRDKITQKQKADKDAILTRQVNNCQQRQLNENFTKQIGTIRICKHLVGDKEAEARARELDRLNRERIERGEPKPECTCSIGRREREEKERRAKEEKEKYTVPMECQFDINTVLKYKALCDKARETINAVSINDFSDDLPTKKAKIIEITDDDDDGKEKIGDKQTAKAVVENSTNLNNVKKGNKPKNKVKKLENENKPEKLKPSNTDKKGDSLINGNSSENKDEPANEKDTTSNDNNTSVAKETEEVETRDDLEERYKRIFDIECGLNDLTNLVDRFAKMNSKMDSDEFCGLKSSVDDIETKVENDLKPKINECKEKDPSSVELKADGTEKDKESQNEVNGSGKSDNNDISGVAETEEPKAETGDVAKVDHVGVEDKFSIQEVAGQASAVDESKKKSDTNTDTVESVEPAESNKDNEEKVELAESNKDNEEKIVDKNIESSIMKNTDDKFPIQEQTGREDESSVIQESKPDNNTNNSNGNSNNPNVKEHDKKVKDFVKCSLLQEKDAVTGRNIVSGFKVVKIEDLENNLYEVNVSAAVVRSDEEENLHKARGKEKLALQDLNSYILSADVLREKIPGLPQRLEWWEGRGFAVAIVNYEQEEKDVCKHWTHFTLKINGYEELAIKKTMLQLLIYVSKRKRRMSHGWNMEVDDVVACILPEESADIADLSISISRGFRFEDRLTDAEKQSLLKHNPTLNLDFVLCGIEMGAAAKTLEKKTNKDKLRKIIDFVAEEELFTKDLPVVDVDKLSKKLNKETVTKSDILWEQLMRKSDKFEMFVLLNKDKVMAQTDWWNLGMRTMDIRLYNNTKDLTKICPICKIPGLNCTCEKNVNAIEPKVVELVERTDYDRVKILGDENGPDLGKMKYTETNLNMDNNKNDKVDKKLTKANKKKEKRLLELSELPARFVEAGIDADKTKITIPNQDKEPMLGKVPIPGADNNDKLAPIPGVQSSLNFTFQNGKKEQTITVTLGAYMPEEKINEMQEQKDLIRLIEEEEKRRNIQQSITVPDKSSSNEKSEKKKKKEKKEKKSKSSQASGTSSTTDGQTTYKLNTELTSKFLEEILCDEEKMKSVKRQMNQHMGLSSRNSDCRNGTPEKEWFIDERFVPKCDCPDHDKIFDMVRKRPLPKTIDEKDRLIQEALGLFEVTNKKGKKKITQIQIKDAPKKCQCGKCEVEAIETFGVEPCEPKQTKKTKKKPGIPVEIVNKVKAANSEVDKSVADSIPDEEVKINGNVVMNGPKSTNGNKGARKKTAKKTKENEEDSKSKDESSDEKEGKNDESLRLCGHCNKIEPTRKAFKKCQKCKDEGVLDVRYYCSRECQVGDWKEKHKIEHRDGLLG